jgi:hypothetical protein
VEKMIGQVYCLYWRVSHSGKKDWTSVLPPMESILKGIKCFVRNVNKTFIKKILFFGVNKSALDHLWLQGTFKTQGQGRQRVKLSQVKPVMKPVTLLCFSH